MLPISQEKNGQVTQSECAGCRNAEGIGFDFEYAYQPIVNFFTRTIYAHEALVRGPNGESAASVLAQVNKENMYSFDQACRVKAVAGAARLGMNELLSINFRDCSAVTP